MALSLGPAFAVEDAVTIDCRSAWSSDVEVITRGERRRFWTPEHKREIVAESLAGDLTLTQVGREHGIGSGLLYTWRQQLLGERVGLTTRSPLRFAQVEITSEAVRTMQPGPPLADPIQAPAPQAHAWLEGLIEIVLPGGVLLRVDAQVDGWALRRVLGAVDG